MSHLVRNDPAGNAHARSDAAGAGFVERVWYGDSLDARLLRLALTPVSALYGVVVAGRNASFDRAARERDAQDAAAGRADARPRSFIPAVSVGNLTVGGTGKTPIAAWCAGWLRERGANPAIVLRGYGDDEPRVHALLTPGAAVVVSPDRSAGMVVAASRGADCAVLDDAFQHRRARRVCDLVLVSADRWRGHAHLLPAGPFREPLDSLRRASLVVLTAKAVGDAALLALDEVVRRSAPGVPVAWVRLVPGTLRLATMLPEGNVGRGTPRPGARDMLMHPPHWLRGRRVVLVSAIGDSDAFEAQMRTLGADILHHARYTDHHAFDRGDASRIAALATSFSGDVAGVVCTLKDAVKLRGVWPSEAPPLWYVSQSVVVERGAEALDQALARVLGARARTTPTAG